jgi:hypothetical protein
MSERTGRARALVVFESMFGNTERLAYEVATGLGEYAVVTLREVTTTPSLESGGYDLVVIGAPTHSFGLSTTRSRAEAWRRGGRMGVIKPGVRDWLASVSMRDMAPTVATFDTRPAAARGLPGSAARAIHRRVRSGNAPVVLPPKHFYVHRERQPIAATELLDARAWGQSLGRVADAAIPQRRKVGERQ